MQKKRYPELDALRGLAAFYIMLFHYTLGLEPINRFFNLGVTAVDLFFLISGFVIFMSINSVSSGREFVINRIARLYPTYWTCVTFSFLIVLLLQAAHFPMNHARHLTLVDYAGNMTMFQYYLNIPNIEVPYWTMIIEMLFYILILVLFKLNLLKRISLTGCLINTLILVNYLLVTQHLIPNLNHYFPLINHFPLFFAGITFYQLVQDDKEKLPGYAIIIFCLLTQSVIYKFAGSDPDHITQVEYISALIVYFAIFTLFINQRLQFVVSRPTVFLGKISFALYLVHSFFFRGLIGFFQKHYHWNFWTATLLIAVPAAISLATVITLYVEKPYSKKLKAFLLKRFHVPVKRVVAG